MFVKVSRGQASPFDESQNRPLQARAGRTRASRPLRTRPKGPKARPLLSDTLRKGLLEAYKLSTFVSAYRHLEDDAFARTVRTLFGKIPDAV